MARSSFLAGLVLYGLAAAVFAQGKGVFGPLESSPGAARENRDLNRSSNPGVAAPLDIRIQGEGVSLPPGVSEDDRPSKPAAETPPQPSALQEGKPKPDAKRP